MNANLNKREFPWPVGHEPTEKEVEKYFEEKGIYISFHWEEEWGIKKRGVLTPRKKTASDLKTVGNDQPVNFQIENQDRKLIEVSKEEFAKWVEEGKNVKVPSKESLVYGVKGNIDGTEIYVERKGQDGFFKESYYEPRSEEDKKQIIERNQKRREEAEENKKDLGQQAQNQENSSNSDKKDTEQQQNQSQKTGNKDDNAKNIYYGVGAISLVLLLISMMVVWVKKKK